MNNYFKIESKIGRGAQHIVGKLGDGQLIKYPHWTGKRWDVSTPKTVRDDLAIHDKYKIPIPKTSIVIEPTIEDGQDIVRPPYAILAEEIHGQIMHETDLSDTNVRKQFKSLLENSLTIRNRTGSGIDFMGFESIKHLIEYRLGKIRADELGTYNIMIDVQEQIKLIDTSLLSPARAPFGVGWAIDALIDIEHSLMSEILQDQRLILQSRSISHSGLMNRLGQEVYRLSRERTTAPKESLQTTVN